MGNSLDVKITADIVDLQQKFATARAETTALGSQMNQLAKQSAAGTLDAAGQSQFAQLSEDYLRAKSSAASYSAQLRETSGATHSLGDSIAEARGKLSSLFAVTGAAAAYEVITKVGQAIMAVGDKAQNILSMSEVLGITTAQFQAMATAAEDAGTSPEVLSRANERLNETLLQARQNVGEAIIKLKELGITNEQIVDPTFNLNKAVQAISDRLKDGSTHVGEMQAAVSLLGGRAAIAAAAWEHYDGSARGVANANAAVNATTKDQTQSLADQGTALKHIASYLGNTAEKAGLYAEAILLMDAGNAKMYADLLRGSAEADAAQQKLNSGADRTGIIQRAQVGAQAQVAAQRQVTAAVLQSEQQQVEAADAGTAQRLAAARKLYQDSLAYYPSAAVPAVEAAYRQMVGAQKEFTTAQLESLQEENAAAKEKYRDDMAAYREQLQQMKDAQKEFETIDRQNAATEIQIQRDTVAAKKSILDAEVGDNANAAAAKFATLRDLVNQENALDVQALQNELKSLEDEPVAYNRVYNEIRELKAKQVEELAALDQQQAAAARKAAQQDSQAWKDGVREIESAESTLVGDLVSKRKSLGASLVQVGAQFLQQEIANDVKAMTTRILLTQTEENSKKALEQGGVLYHLLFSNQATAQTAVSQTAQTQAVITGNAARTAATASGAASARAAGAAANSSVVMADAAKAFSGTYASVAQIPYVGWILAPAAGAAAFAAVAAYEGLASLDQGSYNVPRDMPANIHAGEAVLSKPEARAWRQQVESGTAGAGGGGDIHLHQNFSGLDGLSMKRMAQSKEFLDGMMSAARTHFSRGGR